MKRLLLAIAICSLLLAATAFVFTRRSAAETDLVISLLSFAAPPPKGSVFEPVPPKKPESFYSKTEVPADDAPIEELMDYWSHHGTRTWEKNTYFPVPSNIVVERLKDEIERRPAELTNFFNIFPSEQKTASWVKKLYDDEMSSRALTTEWRSIVKDWLVKNSPYFSDDLAVLAGDVKDDENGYISGQAELVALARVDWEKAKPLVDRLLFNSSQPNTQVAAKWAQYTGALASGSESDIEKYRSELQRIVEDKNALPSQRDLALDALVKEKDWPGRDEWFFSLFSDETLLNLGTRTQTLTGLTTIINESHPEKYKSRLLAMIESGDPNIRSAAAQALSKLCDSDIEVARAMLPWLDNPRWAKDSNNARANLIASLAKHSIPESVPGLINLLDETSQGKARKILDARPAANTATRANTNTSTNEEVEPDEFPFRSFAVAALQTQADGRAVPALRRILFEGSDDYPTALVNALHNSGGFTPTENADALEMNAKDFLAFAKEENAANNPENSKKKTPREVALGMLGYVLSNSESASDETANAVAARIDAIETREPGVALHMRAQLAKWKGAGVNLALLQFLKRGTLDGDGALRLLVDRKFIRERQSSYLSDARTGNSYAAGIAACIMENPSEYDAILEGKDIKAKASLYACGRLIRAELPFDKAAADMNAKDGVLSLAAEKYLETVDTPEARALVLSKHKGEAKILGPFYFFEGVGAPDSQKATLIAELVRTLEPALDTTADGFDASNFFVAMDSFENDAKKIVLTDKSLVRLFAFKKYMLRQYPDKVLLSREDKTGARFWERELHPGEFESFEALLAAERVEETKPVLASAYTYTEPNGESSGAESAELLILGKDGGHRVFSKSANPPRLLQEIEKLFKSMSAEEGRIRYHFEMEVPGAEAVYIGDDLRAATFWKSGADMRVLVNNIPEEKKISKELDQKEEEDSAKPDFNYDTGYQDQWKQRLRRKWESYSWYYLAGQSLGAPAPQPDGVEFIPQRDSQGYLTENDGWKARAQGFEIRADENGLYKISGGQTTVLRKGGYSLPVISPDGRYVIAQKMNASESETGGDALVKINIATRTEKLIAFAPDYDRREPIAYLPSIGKFLLFAGYYDEHGDEGGPPDQDDLSVLMYDDAKFFLLDPVTNVVTEVEGGFAPFAHQTFRPLQPTGRPNEFWAAMPSFDYDTSVKFTRIGVVNSRTGRFRTLVTLNKVFFDSMALWVDEKVYFAYQGHVVSIPKPKLPTAP